MVVLSVSATHIENMGPAEICVNKEICNEQLQTPVTDGAHCVLWNVPQTFLTWKSGILTLPPVINTARGACAGGGAVYLPVFLGLAALPRRLVA